MMIALALPLLAFPPTSAATAAEALRFAPAEGAAVRKTIEHDLTLTQVAHTTVVDGRATSSEGGQELAQHLEVTLVDRYAGLAEGRASELRREFESLTMTSTRLEAHPLNPDPKPLELALESPLEGRTVVFRWQEGPGAYDAALAGSSEDHDWLAGLAEDADLKGFLPPSPDVAEGARWPIEPAAIALVLAPGGDLRFAPSGTSSAAEVPSRAGSSPLDGWIDGEVEGAALATFTGTSTVDGHECAVLRIELDLSSTRDATETARETFAAIPPPDDGETAIELDFSEAACVLKGEGELVWDLTAGRFRALTLEARVGLVVDTAATLTIGADRQEIEISDEYAGTLKVRQDAHSAD